MNLRKEGEKSINNRQVFEVTNWNMDILKLVIK